MVLPGNRYEHYGLNKVIGRLELFYLDNPASYAINVIECRIGTRGWSLIGSGFGHVLMGVVLNNIFIMGHGSIVVKYGDRYGQNKPVFQHKARNQPGKGIVESRNNCCM